VENKEVLQRIQGRMEHPTYHKRKEGKTNCICDIVRRICRLQHVIVGRMTGTRRGGRIRKQIRDYLQEKRSYCSLIKEELNRNLGNSLWKSLYNFRKVGYKRLFHTVTPPVTVIRPSIASNGSRNGE
jgi:hypothetical protein